MAQENLNTSFPNDGLGDKLRNAFIKVQNMFTDLYANVVFKVTGKDLSANDFTDELKTKLDGIEEFAEVNVQSDWNQADNTSDDYIKNKPSTFISYPYKANFPHVGSNIFTMPDGVAVLDVRPCGAGSFIGWSQLGTTLTFTDYTLEAGDYLIIIGIYNDANIFSPLGGVSSVTDDGNTVIEVDNTDPLNPIITFEGVITDGTTIGGSGTLLDPLNVIGGGGGGASTFLELTDTPSTYSGQAGKYPKVNAGETGLEFDTVAGGGGTWGSITGTISDQTDLQSALDSKLKKVSTGSQERVYGVGVDNVQKMISTKEQFVSDADIITALNAITSTVATISVVGKTMYKGQMYVSTSPDYLYVAFDDNLIIRK